MILKGSALQVGSHEPGAVRGCKPEHDDGCRIALQEVRCGGVVDGDHFRLCVWMWRPGLGSNQRLTD